MNGQDLMKWNYNQGSCSFGHLAISRLLTNSFAFTIASIALLFFPARCVWAQQASEALPNQGTIQGVVLINHTPVADAVVRLTAEATGAAYETKTDAAGDFAFARLGSGRYMLSAHEAGRHSTIIPVDVLAGQSVAKIEVTLRKSNLQVSGSTPQTRSASSHAPLPPVSFADAPSFTVAGITDWTAVGGHGSDSILRTSEALARDTLSLKPEQGHEGKTSSDAPEAREEESRLRKALTIDPQSFDANRDLGEFYLRVKKYEEAVPLLEKASRINPKDNRAQYDLALAYKGMGDYKLALKHVNDLLTRENSAGLHRLAGGLDEKLDRPLDAVREYQEAVHLNSSEQNYFDLGSELLFHRAVWQALEVFREGAKAYPKSSRMLVGLGVAQFAGARYDKAAATFCVASDIDPSNVQPYLFMGKAEMSAPGPLPCVESRLEKFVRERPDNSIANYLYAMAILKRHQLSADAQATQQAEGYLENAIRVDAGCGEAYLELGILAYSRHDTEKAIDFYKKAIETRPQLSESYYRLGVAYDRLGKKKEAREQFQLHDAINKKQSEAVEEQRREIKQFLIAPPKDASSISTQ